MLQRVVFIVTTVPWMVTNRRLIAKWKVESKEPVPVPHTYLHTYKCAVEINIFAVRIPFDCACVLACFYWARNVAWRNAGGMLTPRSWRVHKSSPMRRILAASSCRSTDQQSDIEWPCLHSRTASLLSCYPDEMSQRTFTQKLVTGSKKLSWNVISLTSLYTDAVGICTWLYWKASMVDEYMWIWSTVGR